MSRRSLCATRSTSDELWLSSVAEARNLTSMWRDLPQQIPPISACRWRRWSSHNPLPAGRGTAALELDSLHCATSSVRFGFDLAITRRHRRQCLGRRACSRALLLMIPASQGRASTFGMPRPALVAMLLLNPVALLHLAMALRRRSLRLPVTPGEF